MAKFAILKPLITMINFSDIKNLKSWIEVDSKSDFPIQNIPFGIVANKSLRPQVATIVGNTVVLLSPLYEAGLFKGILTDNPFLNEVLNPFISLGKMITNKVRQRLIELLSVSNQEINNNESLKSKCLLSASEVSNLLPVRVGDYTDFYSSRQHATNVGKMFRDPDNALLPNWLHIPVGYHGRASSITVSGSDFYRPKGQRKGPNDPAPVYGPSVQLDFELEVGFVVGKSNQLGETVSTKEAPEYIFGFVLFNDWSARDIQAWEYVPLGPFLGKNFFSSVSPWVVTLEALEPFRVEGEKQIPEVLSYLKFEGNHNLDINLEVLIKPENTEETIVCKSNYKYMYWNMVQQLAHHTVNGCNLNVGDVLASGTISGNTEDSYGSMLEITWRGTKPVSMKDGSERKFINDNDSVIIKGYGEREGVRIGFGNLVNKVLPAL
jgi:fumarylacetoacetase